MALDSDNVRVAVTGAVYVGPTSATAPTASDSLTTGFTDLGYISEAGVAEDFARTTNQIRAMQNGALVREVTSSGTYTVNLTLLETNLATLELYFGAALVAGVLSGDPTQTGGRKSFIIDAIDGTSVERTYIPAGEVTAVGTRTLASTDAIAYTVTITAYADSSNVTYKKFFSTFEV